MSVGRSGCRSRLVTLSYRSGRVHPADDRCENDQGTQKHHAGSDPYPYNERIEKRFDHWQTAVLVPPLIDNVYVPQGRGTVRNHGLDGLTGLEESCFRGKLELLFTVPVNINQRTLTNIMVVGVRC